MQASFPKMYCGGCFPYEARAVQRSREPCAAKVVCRSRCKASSLAAEGSSGAGAANIDSLAAEFDAQCQALLRTSAAEDLNVH